MSDTIRQYAFEIAESVASRQTRLRVEKLDLQAKLDEVKTKLDRAETAIDRARAFHIRVNGRLQCPRCWVEDEVAADLAPIPNGDGEDAFRCGICRSKFVIPD